MKIFLDSIGCRLNQAELEIFGRQLRHAGHEIVPNASEADLTIVNTCMVTAQAAADSRAAIRRAARRGTGGIVATGCWATLEPAAGELPGVSRVFNNQAKDTLVADLLGVPPEMLAENADGRIPLPGAHARTRAFIKAQDGCDNACTYCITRLARGAARSLASETVIHEIQSALEGGTKEVVLTGVHLGAWGCDLQPKQKLKDLIEAILASARPRRLRLSSLELWDLNSAFFRLWEDPILCPHLHLPLQSGSLAVLRRMNRKTTPDEYQKLVALIRRVIPEAAITTDVMVGFPGETEAEFQESVKFVQAVEFAGGHIFSYSARPGTAAARMDGQVPPAVRKERSGVLREVFADSARKYQQQFVGRTLDVLWEFPGERHRRDQMLEGLTSNYLRVRARGEAGRWNELDEVRITGVNGEILAGEIASPEK